MKANTFQTYSLSKYEVVGQGKRGDVESSSAICDVVRSDTLATFTNIVIVVRRIYEGCCRVSVVTRRASVVDAPLCDRFVPRL